jgi:hypothetical protein
VKQSSVQVTALGHRLVRWGYLSKVDAEDLRAEVDVGGWERDLSGRNEMLKYPGGSWTASAPGRPCLSVSLSDDIYL